MNTDFLIDSILRQTAILVAEAATAEGERASLAGVADRLFLHLAQELADRGLTSKVIADMQGLALSSYLQKAARLQESHVGRGQTLWQVLYAWLHERGEVLRTDLLRRFRHEDETLVRGLLNDMLRSGLISREGRGTATVYRCERITAPHRVDGDDMDAAETALIWFTVYRKGPISTEEVAALLRIDVEGVAQVLASLHDEGRVRTLPGEDGVERHQADTLVLSREEPGDVEAALLDHLEAAVETIRRRMALVSDPHAHPLSDNGGSTFRFELAAGHPREAELRSLLERTRSELSALWMESVGGEAAADAKEGLTIVFYIGQHVETHACKGET